jgi:fructokinase
VKTIDILCIGEVLIDCIGHELNASIQLTQNYHRYLGGSPTNLAQYAASLGLRVQLVASCGQDGLGDFIVNELQDRKIPTQHVRRTPEPTSIILVSRSTQTPDFIAYRNADCSILPSQIDNETIANARLFHTTCFALSKNPAQSTILEKAKLANELGLQLSIDLNYSEKIWPDKAEAQAVIAEYLSYNPLVKISVDDCFRYFGESKSEEFIFDYFHGLGAELICYTKGSEGVVVSDKTNGLYSQAAQPIAEIKDATGAGDAFWTGFLYGQLQQYSLESCVTLAQKLAVLKLQTLGALPAQLHLNEHLTV